MADYDRDGWLDIYFCFTPTTRVPTNIATMPYYDAENGWQIS
jgi:hypothetical protein